MKTETVAVDSLTPDPGNLREHGKRNLAAIVASLVKFGQQRPILVGPGDVVIAGNGTLEGLRQLGRDTVDIVRTDLEGMDAVGYAIADNRTAELATWKGELARALGDLRDCYDAHVTGFTGAEIDKLVAEATALSQVLEDDVPEPPAEAITKPGDLILLGGHRLLCGDSASAADVDCLLAADPGKESKTLPIHLVNCDPPYNVQVEPASTGSKHTGQRPSSWRSTEGMIKDGVARGGYQRSAVRRATSSPKGRRLANDFLSEDEFEAICAQWFAQIARVLKPGRGFYVWGSAYPAAAGSKANSELFPQLMRPLGLRFSQLIVWNKGSGVINRKDFMGQYEVCFYGWREGAAHRFVGPNNATDMWAVKKVAHQSMVHLTEKPVELAARAIQYSSRAAENVLDLFGGSGSTLIAAEQTGRKAFLMELDPLYCDVIVTRWENFTGKKGDRRRARSNAPQTCEALVEGS